MDIRAAQGSTAAVREAIAGRLPMDQFSKLAVTGLENGQTRGASPKYEKQQPKRKSTPDLVYQNYHNNHNNVQPIPPSFAVASKTTDDETKKDLLKPGDVLKSRWRVLSKIGGGGFGEIYEAVDTQADSGALESSSLCPLCASKLDGHAHNPASNHASALVQTCTACGRKFVPTATANHDLQRHLSESTIELVDSGNSSTHSDKVTGPDNRIVAVKAESNTQPKQMLRMEVAVMRRLKNKKNFCDLLACGRNARINYIIMTLQGKNLSELRKNSAERCFSRSTSLRIICKCLDAVEAFHSIGFLHRDIKPSNFCLRKDDPTEVCLLDFGLARQFTTTGSLSQLRPPRNSAGFRGTVRYASINAHKYRELGRHDDLWSMYYMLVEFLKGTLPWNKISQKEIVKNKKMETDPIELGVTSGLPKSIASVWVNHLKGLSYYTAPNYRELRRVIENWLSANGVEWNEPYDWDRRPMTHVQSATTFAPLFKRNQVPTRQFVQNSKRLAHHDSSGCLKRLDKRSFGSNMELKRLESEGAEGSTAAFVGRSTAALCEDALTNQSKTQVPGCVTLATENLLQEDGAGNANESSDKVDGKEKLMASHIDLAAIGEPRRPAQGAEPTDKQFLPTGTPQTRPSLADVLNFSGKPQYHRQLSAEARYSLVNSFTSPTSPLPPTPPPHKTAGRENDLVFLHPENRPLLPPTYPTTPPMVPSLFHEDLHNPAARLPPPYRIRRGTVDSPAGQAEAVSTLPTPKPRSRYSDILEATPEEVDKVAEPTDDRNGWFCRDDLQDGFRPTLLSNPYYRFRSRSPTKGESAISPLQLLEVLKTRSSSAEHLEDGISKPSPHLEPKNRQMYRSLNTLAMTTPDPIVYTSQAVTSNNSNGDNSKKDLVRKGNETWLPVIDGRTRSASTDIASNRPASLVVHGAAVGVIRRPTQTLSGKSTINWRPVNPRDKAGTSLSSHMSNPTPSPSDTQK
uniref:non-specific serine/threonine protein kinase n=1 Tax=Mesocestoides corti TaxID=53468 RepID=A0A5K3FJB6_MESCO